MVRERCQSYFLVFSVLLILGLAHAFYPKWQQPGSEATLSWDVFGYYFYLPAYFIYDDLEKLDFIDKINTQYQPTGGAYHVSNLENGNSTGQYSLGWSFFHFPAFVCGHLAAKIFGFPADGFSKPYQIAVSFYGLFVSFFGVLFTFFNLRNYFSFKVSYAAILLLLLGTNALNYFAIDTGHTHGPLFFLYALLVYLSISWHFKPSLVKSVLIGLTLGLMVSMRPTEIIAVLIPLGWGVFSFKSWHERSLQFSKSKLLLFLAIISFLFFPVIQLIYWKNITGQFLFYSYSGQTFSWLHPHLLDVFISHRKGWLMYTPLAVLFLIGMPFLYKKNKTIFLVVIVFALLNYYIVSSWDIWWYGGSLGQRALVQAYAVMIFAFAAVLHYSFKNNIAKVALLLFSTFAVLHNLSFHYKAHSSAPFEAEAMTKAFFNRTYLEFQQKEDFYKLLDTKFLYEGTISEKKAMVYTKTKINLTEFQQVSDTIIIRAQDFEGFSYCRIVFDAASAKVNSYYWNMPQLNVQQLCESKNSLENNYLRIHRFMKAGETKSMYFDIKLNVQTRQIRIYLSSPNAVNHVDLELKEVFVFK